MAKAHAKKSGKALKQGGLGGKTFGFLSLVIAAMALPSSMLFALGMVPTGVAYMIDADPRKTAAISVGSINLCGVLPFLVELWGGPNTIDAATSILGHIETWAVMYAAAALGWMVYYAVPPIIGGFIAFNSTGRVRELERRQAALRETWGDEVGGPA